MTVCPICAFNSTPQTPRKAEKREVSLYKLVLRDVPYVSYNERIPSRIAAHGLSARQEVVQYLSIHRTWRPGLRYVRGGRKAGPSQKKIPSHDKIRILEAKANEIVIDRTVAGIDRDWRHFEAGGSSVTAVKDKVEKGNGLTNNSGEQR